MTSGTFAIHLVMSGADLTTVKDLLEHKTLNMGMRYAHLSQSHKRKAVEILSTVLDGHNMDTEGDASGKVVELPG